MDEKKFILGSIDTVNEVLLILNQLKLKQALRINIDKIDIELALADLKKIRNESMERMGRHFIMGAVDTPWEVEIFLKYLREKKILQSPVDTDEEITLFMEKLQNEGFFSPSLLQARIFQNTFFLQPKDIKKIARKKPTPKGMEEEDSDSDSDQNTP